MISLCFRLELIWRSLYAWLTFRAYANLRYGKLTDRLLRNRFSKYCKICQWCVCLLRKASYCFWFKLHVTKLFLHVLMCIWYILQSCMWKILYIWCTANRENFMGVFIPLRRPSGLYVSRLYLNTKISKFSKVSSDNLAAYVKVHHLLVFLAEQFSNTRNSSINSQDFS